MTDGVDVDVVVWRAGSDVLANVITGVAMVAAAAGRDQISFYFGCVAQATGMGGAGLFVGSHDDASARRVYPLRSNDSAVDRQVRAGTMFVADSDMCDVAAIWQQITGRNSAVVSHFVLGCSWHWPRAVIVTAVVLRMTCTPAYAC